MEQCSVVYVREENCSMVLIVVCCIVKEFYRTGMHLRYILEVDNSICSLSFLFALCCFKVQKMVYNINNRGFLAIDQSGVKFIALGLR